MFGMYWLTFKLSTICCFCASDSVRNIPTNRIVRAKYEPNRYYHMSQVEIIPVYISTTICENISPSSLSKQYAIKLLNFANLIGEKWCSSIILMCISVSSIQYNIFQSRFFIRMVYLNKNEFMCWFAFLQPGWVALIVLIRKNLYFHLS